MMATSTPAAATAIPIVSPFFSPGFLEGESRSCSRVLLLLDSVGTVVDEVDDESRVARVVVEVASVVGVDDGGSVVFVLVQDVEVEVGRGP